jgi:hypothetical protein
MGDPPGGSEMMEWWNDGKVEKKATGYFPAIRYSSIPSIRFN